MGSQASSDSVVLGMSNQSLRILACDDDELLLELLRHRLTSKGYSVDTAMDGREALEKIQASAPDALVLDAMMPLVDGYEVLRQFRAMDGMQSVPVVFLSARKHETLDKYFLALERQGRGRHKLAGGARIWFYVEEMEVVLIRVSTNHPNETKT